MTWRWYFSLGSSDGCTGPTGRKMSSSTAADGSRRPGWMDPTVRSSSRPTCCGPTASRSTTRPTPCTGATPTMTTSRKSTSMAATERLVNEWVSSFVLTHPLFFCCFLFFFDQLTDVIYSTQVVYSGKELNHPFGIAHYQNYVFWTDYMNASIFRLDLSHNDVALMRAERPPLFGIQVYDPQSQKGKYGLSILDHKE